MNFVATFVSGPARPVLTDDLLAQVAQCLPAAQQPRWLDTGIAADIMLEVTTPEETRALNERVSEKLAGAPVDFFLQPLATRRKKLFVADMDSTMIMQECIDELADFIGQKSYVAEITERAMRGEIAFEPALRERVALLGGLSVDVAAKVLAERISLTSGARTLVQTMRAHGTYCVLVSGGFTLFTREVAARIGFDADQANVLVVEDGKLAGRVEEPILGKAAKLEALLHFCKARNVSASETLAVGDGANDLAMLENAGLGVAFHAKPAVAAAAHARIDYGDLTALLYAQGYRRTDFRE